MVIKVNISTENLQVTLGDTEIVKGITLEIESGKTIGIIGPNGSGKSTFLKSLYRVIKPTSGAVYLDGKDLGKHSVKESAKLMSVVAQHNYYNFDFTVEEMVLMGRSPHKKKLDKNTKEDYDITKESLKLVGLEEFSHREFSTLSGGEQQRVILARALTQKSPCILLDEPTNHLDIKHQLEIMEIVTKQQGTIIAAIHDLNIAARYCDKLYVLKDGQVVNFGETNKVLTKEMIEDVFQVDAEIVKTDSGKMLIGFKSLA